MFSDFLKCGGALGYVCTSSGCDLILMECSTAGLLLLFWFVVALAGLCFPRTGIKGVHHHVRPSRAKV